MCGYARTGKNVVMSSLCKRLSFTHCETRESQPLPTLLAYSGGSVTANGALLGPAVAMLRLGSDGVFAIVRLASADTALSSGRSE